MERGGLKREGVNKDITGGDGGGGSAHHIYRVCSNISFLSHSSCYFKELVRKHQKD